MRYLTAGESHGKALMGILEGIPSGLFIDFALIDAELSRRQKGYGRGGRMKIEKDGAEFISGIRASVTTGAPIGFIILNRDYENWADIIGPRATNLEAKKLTAVRPGHADLAGAIKYDHADCRNVLERASARNTATLTVIGAIAKQYLSALGISIGSKIISVGGETDPGKQKARIDFAMSGGDTLGGELELIASGMPVGTGSFISPDKRLEFKLSGFLAAIPSVKSVSIGDECAHAHMGSEVHDAVFYDENGRIKRQTNRAGGIEGGISNGEDIVIRLKLKPVPSVSKGVPSIDIETKRNSVSAVERGDTVVVEPACVVAEGVLAYALAEAISETFGGDTMGEVIERVRVRRT
jgi:chorismate synthase